MIALLQGKVHLVQPELRQVIVLVQGVGYRVFAPTAVLSACQAGREVTLYTHHYLREDTQDLYGFLESEQLRLFEQLLAVSGVGPKVALALLSHYPVPVLVDALQRSDVAVLTEVSGVGKKLAERLVLELKDSVILGQLPSAGGGVTSSEAMAALVTLGYSQREASAALQQIDRTLPLEQQVKLALQHLG